MALITSPYPSVGLDLEPICKPWTASLNDATDKRMMNRAAALRSLAIVLNHMLGRYPRVMMAQNMKHADAEAVGADPLYEWHYDDQVANGRSSTISIAMTPRSAGAADCYAGRYTGAAVTEATSLFNSTAAAATLYTDMQEATYQVARGAAGAAEIDEALSTFSGYTVTGFSVQDDEISQLNTANNDYVDPSQAKKGQEVLADLLEEIRSKFHDLQTSNLSKFISWSAQRIAAGWQTPSPGNSDASGIAINSNTFVNLIDQSIAARTATSPGLSCHVRNAGWGAQDENNGKLIKCQCRVHAAVTGAGGLHGIVRFHGPSFAAGGGANNFTDITVTNGAAQTWWGGAGNFIYLDSTAADTDVTTNRNKVDMFGKIDGGVTNEVLYIYGLSGWQDNPPY